jgi:hypothetical protein
MRYAWCVWSVCVCMCECVIVFECVCLPDDKHRCNVQKKQMRLGRAFHHGHVCMCAWLLIYYIELQSVCVKCITCFISFECLRARAAHKLCQPLLKFNGMRIATYMRHLVFKSMQYECKGEKWYLPKWKGYELRPGVRRGMLSGDPHAVSDVEQNCAGMENPLPTCTKERRHFGIKCRKTLVLVRPANSCSRTGLTELCGSRKVGMYLHPHLGVVYLRLPCLIHGAERCIFTG